MSNKIDDLKVELGTCIRVKNVEKQENPKRRAADANEYIAIQIEGYTGDAEECILLTHVEHTDMETVQIPEGLMKHMVFGRLYPVTLGKVKTCLIKVKHWDGRERILRLSDSQYRSAKYRACTHPKSCTKKAWLTDLMD